MDGFMKEMVWVGEQFSSPEDFKAWEIENQHRILSPSRISSISSCPRKYQHQYRDFIRKKETPNYMSAGGLIHTGVDHWYVTKDIEGAIEAMRAVDYPDAGADADHLQAPALEIVVRNYADHWTQHDAYDPLTVTFDEMNLDSVLAARWRTTDDGKIILAESPFMMIVPNPHGEDLIVTGIPDLPVIDYGGTRYILDHKSTQGYISSFWKSKYSISDQFRTYCVMESQLLGVTFAGTVLDAIYMGKYATSTTSKAVKFDRDPYNFDETMLDETIQNMNSWVNRIADFTREDYFPQSTGMYCGGCFFKDICKEPVWAREVPLDSERGTARSILDPR